MEITTVYQKARHEFGRPVIGFMPTEAQLVDEFLPEKELFGTFIERNPSVLDVQAMPEMSEHEVRPYPARSLRAYFAKLSQVVLAPRAGEYASLFIPLHRYVSPRWWLA